MDPITPNIENSTEKSSVGALIGIIVIIIILVAGAVYVWTNKTPKEQIVPENKTDVAKVESTTSAEEDLDSINLDGLDEAIK